MSTFSDFMQEKGVDPAQLVQQSRALESFRPEDRELRLARAKARRTKKSYEEAGAPKPERYGRGLSLRTVENALEGRPVSRINRKKIVRALEATLAQKDPGSIDAARLFSDAPKKKPKKK
jgi:hypothetical protein